MSGNTVFRSVVIVCMIAAGCAEPGREAERDGQASVRVDVAAVTGFDITRVTVEALGVTHDLTKNPIDLSFAGVVGLPAGMQLLTARAFSGEELVGISAPTPVEIQVGGVSQVAIAILDTSTGGQPSFGPIFESLTHPMSVGAGRLATFAVSAISPANAPVAYAWSAPGCPDSTFSDPTSAMTTWQNPTARACLIAVTATASGITTATDFSIEVFDVGSEDGAASVVGTFVPAPAIQLSLPALGCDVSPSAVNASCPTPVRAPQRVEFLALAGSLAVLSSLTVSDDCGGQVDPLNHDPTAFHGDWLPPPSGGFCILTARAVNTLGGVGQLSAAILVLPGTAITAPRR